ncbi:sulfurtransferase [Frateuria sp. STR12]|uniref:sulfurtransferase n=1 Tax=Frateuria hangzhouensis TaxID=2995589 RepID=UPI002260D2BC|nr:sulfurtransferase [Frateuria sp. STR12]MCX7512536.1 sulfurtransferase [Frateuria sp. STR12]
MIVNVAAYRFVPLADLPALRASLYARAEAAALKGTILLAPEGINLFLAGARAGIDAFLAWLREDPRFAGLPLKESLSAQVPFGRLRVRLKREIITLRAPVAPHQGRAPTVEAATLKRWLDQGHDDSGRDVVLLDTRNDYETDAGRFAGAIDYRLPSFTALPGAVLADRERYLGKTIVSYCTGGIRCEKAALHLANLGLGDVLQLEGGILKYLEQTDGSYWEGDCFVFDGRGAVDHDLRPAGRPLPPGENAVMGSGSCTGPDPDALAEVAFPADSGNPPRPSAPSLVGTGEEVTKSVA